MTLQTRLQTLISAVGPDIKSLQSKVNMHEQGQALLPNTPAQVTQANMPISMIGAAAVVSLVNQRLQMVRCPVKAGVTITGISWFSIAAGSIVLNQYAGLYGQDRAQLALSSNLGATPWGANARQRFILPTPYTPSQDTWLYVGVSVNATTPPTLAGAATPLQITSLEPILHGYSSLGVPPPSNPVALTAEAGLPIVMLD